MNKGTFERNPSGSQEISILQSMKLLAYLGPGGNLCSLKGNYGDFEGMRDKLRSKFSDFITWQCSVTLRKSMKNKAVLSVECVIPILVRNIVGCLSGNMDNITFLIEWDLSICNICFLRIELVFLLWIGYLGFFPSFWGLDIPKPGNLFLYNTS